MGESRFWVYSILTALAACDELPPDSTVFDIALSSPETVISLESELLGQPSDLAVAPDGRLWVADVRGHRLLTVAPDGSDPVYVGQEGEGPGEFRAPSGIVAGEDRVRVIDMANGRVQDYALDGSHIADWLVPVPLNSGPSAADLGGRLIASSSGTDSALATVHFLGETDPATALKLGPLITRGSTFFDMTSIKNRIAEGDVPDEMRNFVIPIGGHDGVTWLLVETETEVRKYGADGALQWQQALDGPEVEAARADFFRRNNEDDNPSRVFPLVTMRDAAEVDGALWVLMWTAPGAPAVFYILDADDGTTIGRVSVPTPDVASGFTIDMRARRLYIAIADEASVLAVDITDVRW